MEWAARLYPAAWRRRYGAEFGALLEESGGGWIAVVDVLKGALAMQIRSWSVWRFVAVCAVIGAAVAGIASWRMPQRYVSEAVLRVDANDPMTRELLGRISQEVLSRTTLTTMISSHGLYNTDRTHVPIEDNIRDMRARITTSLVANNPSVFKISFMGSSPAQAKHVAGLLVSQFIDKNFEKRGAVLPSAVVEVLDPPTLPQRPTSPHLWKLMAVGVVPGVLLGLLAFRLAIGSKRNANA
jgi:uncharacterized protein involved in exopolysaccharide biosynthesis